MTVERLRPKAVEKVWGRRDLPPPFGPIAAESEPVGEIRFEGPADDSLLVKYLFTSEKLSVQVHPDEEAARRLGLRSGKEEAWWVLAAEQSAAVGLGLTESVEPERLRAAALDGSIERMLDWRPVRTGDFLYSPAGTVHAIGAGLSIVEIQQNADVTYRLYDYGRDRALHLEEAIAVAKPGPWEPSPPPFAIGRGREILALGRAFVVERWTGPLSATLRGGPPLWLIPISGSTTAGAERLESGDVWRIEGETALGLEDGAVLLAAYAGGKVRESLVAG